MNSKKISGLVAIVIGVALLLFGFYVQDRMTGARGDIEDLFGFIPENPVTGYVEEGLHKKVDRYNSLKNLGFIGGAIFIVGGIALMGLGKRKRR